MNRKTVWLGVLLVAVMAMFTACATSGQQDQQQRRGTFRGFTWELSSNGDVTITGYARTSTNIRIPYRIQGRSVTSIGSAAFRFNQLRNVTIPSSVTSIGALAFADNQLISITIPDSVTSIGMQAFVNNQLTNVILSASITSIENGAFGNNQLASVTIPNSVVSIGSSAFFGNQLSNLDIPDSVVSIGSSAFRYNRLMSFSISDSVVSIGANAFRGNQLSSVNIPDSVTFIGARAFWDNQLSSTPITAQQQVQQQTYQQVQLDWELAHPHYSRASNFKWSNIGSSVVITDFIGSNTDIRIPPQLYGMPVTKITSLVFNEHKLTTASIPDSITYIGWMAFANNQLVKVTIGNNVTYIGGRAFTNNQLTGVIIPDSVTTIGREAFANNQLTSVIISNNITSIEREVFANNQLTSVIIPNSVTSIHQHAFTGNQLTSVPITARQLQEQMEREALALQQEQQEAQRQAELAQQRAQQEVQEREALALQRAQQEAQRQATIAQQQVQTPRFTRERLSGGNLAYVFPSENDAMLFFSQGHRLPDPVYIVVLLRGIYLSTDNPLIQSGHSILGGTRLVSGNGGPLGGLVTAFFNLNRDTEYYVFWRREFNEMMTMLAMLPGGSGERSYSSAVIAITDRNFNPLTPAMR